MVSARDWTLVLFGRFVRAGGGWISVRQLIDLNEPLGADAASTRTAVSRMKRAGFVRSELRDGVAGYRLTDIGEAFFADGDRRIVERAAPDDRWVLASFSVPESQRSIRYKIRSRLVELGFGQMSAGLLIAPAGLHAEAERTLRREELAEWVLLWVAEFGALGAISTVVEQSWDTSLLRGRYDTYVARATEALGLTETDDANGFVRYMQLNNEWRELRYLDPGLPAAVIGQDWPQPEAADLADAVEAQLHPAANRHYDARTSLFSRTSLEVV